MSNTSPPDHLPRTRRFAIVAASLVAMHFVVAAVRIRAGAAVERWTSLFDLDAESNVPTWFASVVLLACAWRCFACSRRSEDPRLRSGFVALGGVFVALSCDEVAMVHERVAASLLDGFRARGIAPGTVWAIGALVTVAIGVPFIAFLRALPRIVARNIVLAGGVFVTGAVGIEALGHAYARAHGFWNWTYVSLAGTEEALEFAGAIAFLHVLGGVCASDVPREERDLR